MIHVGHGPGAELNRRFNNYVRETNSLINEVYNAREGKLEFKLKYIDSKGQEQTSILKPAEGDFVTNNQTFFKLTREYTRNEDLLDACILTRDPEVAKTALAYVENQRTKALKREIAKVYQDYATRIEKSKELLERFKNRSGSPEAFYRENGTSEHDLQKREVELYDHKDRQESWELKQDLLHAQSTARSLFREQVQELEATIRPELRKARQIDRGM